MATIIRKNGTRLSSSESSPQAVAFSFADMQGKAEDYLDSVRGEAAKIVQQANRDAEKIRREAEAAGQKAAQEAAEKVLDEKVAQRMATVIPALQDLVKQIDDARGEMQAHWERSALQVVTAIAERVIRRELRSDPQITLDTVAETLRLAAGSSEMTLHLNPVDYSNLGPQVERLANTLCKLSPSQIVADDAISPGGCLVQTRFGEVDQRIEAQLCRIEEDLA